MAEELLEGMEEPRKEISFTFTKGKALMIDILLMLLLICAVVGGIWFGEHRTSKYYHEYMETNCNCELGPSSDIDDDYRWDGYKYIKES